MADAYKGLIQTTKKTNSVSGTAILLRRSDLGFDPSQIIASTQVNCDNLGGGTFEVRIYPPGAAAYKVHETGMLETDTVIILRDVIFEAIEVAFSGVAGLQTVVLNSRKLY